MSKNDENFIAFCDELRAYVEEHGLFPPKHTNMLSRIKYVKKKIKVMFGVIGQIPSIMDALRDGKSIKVQKGDFSVDVTADKD